MIACFLWLQNESEDQITRLSLVRKWSGKQISQGQGKVSEFY